MSRNLNLVHENYYVKGANHTAQMNIKKRSFKFNNSIYVQSKIDKVILFFPDRFDENIQNGKILFFRPSDNALDFSVDIQLDNSAQKIDKKKLQKGRYIVKFLCRFSLSGLTPIIS